MNPADTEQIPAEVSAYLGKIGRKGGQSVTWKKSCASRKNGKRACRPGKKRGRPPKKKLVSLTPHS